MSKYEQVTFPSSGRNKVSGILKFRLFVISSFLLLATIPIYFHPAGNSSLDPIRSDHVSHLSTAILFLYKGLDLYRHPSGNLVNRWSSEKSRPYQKEYHWPEDSFVGNIPERHGKHPLLISWAHMPRAYPLGHFFIFGIFAVAHEYLGISYRVCVQGLIVLFLFFAHASFYLILTSLYAGLRPQLLGSRRTAWWLTLICVGVTCYGPLMRWSLNGVFDSVSVFFLALAAQYSTQTPSSHSFSRLSLFYSLSLFSQFRALYLAPLMLSVFQKSRSFKNTIETIKPHTLSEAILYGTSLVLMFISFYNFFLLYGSILALEPNNKLYIPIFDLTNSDSIKKAIVSLGVIVLVLWGFLRQYAFLLATIATWSYFMCWKSPIIQQWYLLFLLPLFAVPHLGNRKPQQSLLFIWIFYTMIASLFMRNSPVELRLFKEIYWYLF